MEAQYAEWLEARIGAGDSEATSLADEEENLTFSRSAILEHLERCKHGLVECLEQRKQAGEDNLSEALARATVLLEEVSVDLAASSVFDSRRLEDSLTALERMLDDAVRSVVSTERFETLHKEMTVQLKPYKPHMEKAVYQQTVDNLILKKLREECSVPRLSLFYL